MKKLTQTTTGNAVRELHPLVRSAIHEAIDARMEAAAREAHARGKTFTYSEWLEAKAGKLARGLQGERNDEVAQALLSKVASLDSDLERLNEVRRSLASSKDAELKAALARTEKAMREKEEHKQVLMAAAGITELKKC